MAVKNKRKTKAQKEADKVPVVEENIEVVDFKNEFGSRYRDYALYVIMDRSLPDVRDGMKPVHRRNLYAMFRGGYNSAGGTVKCARIVGDVIGKYHPHGDASVYDALARMAQDWTYRYPVVTPQGNFGSIDGDRQAAMRYTEAKLAPFGELAVNKGLRVDAVDFVDNYDGKTQEPSVLPVEVPFLLLNSISGIAVGIATDFVSHNLKEVMDTCISFSEYRQRSESFDKDAEVLKNITGPDFPTAGVVVTSDLEMKTIYSNGKGKMTLRARIEKEDLAGGKWRLVVTEMPYSVNKQDVIINIAEMIKAGNSKGGKTTRNSKGMEKLFSDVYDETEDGKIRIVLEPRTKNLDPEELKMHLYSVTNLQTTVKINMNALVDKGTRPKRLSFAECVDHFLDFREEVEIRQATNRLEKVEARLHILDGLVIAYLNIEEVIEVVRYAKSKEDGKQQLMAKFGLSDIQADDIVNLRLYQLQKISETEIKKEQRELKSERKHLRSIIKDVSYRLGLMIDRFREIIDKFGDERRTEITYGAAKARTVSATVIVDREPATAILTNRGWIKHVKSNAVDVTKTKLKEGDSIKQFMAGHTTDHVAFISKKGRVFTKLMADLPPARTDGSHIGEFFTLAQDDEILRMVVLDAEATYFAYNSCGYGFKVAAANMINSQKKGKQIFTLPVTVTDINMIPLAAHHAVAFITSEDKIGVVMLSAFPALGKGKGVQTIRIPRGNSLTDAFLLTVDDQVSPPKFTWPKSGSFSFDTSQVLIDRARAGVKQQKRALDRVRSLFK